MLCPVDLPLVLHRQPHSPEHIGILRAAAGKEYVMNRFSSGFLAFGLLPKMYVKWDIFYVLQFQLNVSYYTLLYFFLVTQLPFNSYCYNQHSAFFFFCSSLDSVFSEGSGVCCLEIVWLIHSFPFLHIIIWRHIVFTSLPLTWKSTRGEWNVVGTSTKNKNRILNSFLTTTY